MTEATIYPIGWVGTPTVTTVRKAKRALLASGLFGTTVEGLEATMMAVFNTLPEPDRSAAIIDWKEATEFDLNYPSMQALKPALGLTDKDLLNLFKLAAAIPG